MNIDERICIIMKKMEDLETEWDKPLKKEIVERYEKENGIVLPEDYKRFITTVAGSGAQPFYGLYRLLGEPKQPKSVDINKKFPLTIKKPFDLFHCEELSDEEFEDTIKKIKVGYVFLCHEGCGMYSVLIVNAEDKDTYGTVWYYDFANDAGLFPLINPATNNTMSFLDWLEYYVYKTLELDDSDYFSYGEIAGVVK